MEYIIDFSNSKSEIVKSYIDLKDGIVGLGDKNMKTIMITSPREEREHSNVAANLSVIMSKSGYKTLIIDCNIENSSLHKFFDVEEEFGLSDYVFKNKCLDDVVKNTELGELKVITAGKQESYIFGNEKIEGLIEEGKKQFDYIILNATAVLNGNGSQVLAKYCDGIVIVVEHEKTELEELKKVQVKLGRYKEKILGSIVNNYRRY